MSIDVAINNVGEYFSAQYLADSKGFIKDIKVKSDAWKTQGSQSAPRKLQALGESYFKAKAKALDYPEPVLRNQANEAVIDSWHYQILEALGYQPEAQNIELLSEGKQIPVMLRLNRNSQPWLVIAQTPFCLNSGDHVEDPLEEMVEPSSKIIEDLPTFVEQWEQAIAVLLKQENHPRWVMLLAGSRIYLFDAHTYAQGRYLYVDLDEAYGRKDIATFNATAALLSKEALAPESETDEVLHEKLREGSLKATHGVSAKLQSAVREAIELIANGWVDARRAQGNGYKQLGEQEQPLADGSREVHAEQLKHDALVYVYRILFCLYGEARGGELGILPISDDVYRLGYSIEALRDLADRGEPSTQSESGRYYAEHLTRLFRLVHQGFHPDADKKTASSNAVGAQGNHLDLFGQGQTDMFGQDKAVTSKSGNQVKTGTYKTFVIQPLTATLFDPKTTPLLDRVKLSNKVLQQVIRRLSLGTGSSNKQIDRINYAELGIVQLGSVYEGLLSYKGFFAKEELIQVTQAEKKKKVKGKNAQPLVYDDAIDPKQATWFVPSSREHEFKEGEIIIEGNTEKARKYAPGTFILHLNGVDRVNSASYYTPEVLTRCLVKEALKERLKDFGPDQADEILELKICEPAMGSAAFLVEAIDQLARHYLVLKQEQIKESIDPSAFEEELGRVKHYIAVRNVYGVDLNPTAVELGSLSLWLASIHRLKVQTGENGAPDVYQPGQTPWFGLRLRAGNSLIGARRAVWTHEQLINGINLGKNAAAPRQLKPGEQRGEKEIYHFLVWDEDMAPAARDKLMKQHWKDDCDVINQWQKDHVKKKWSPEELAIGRDISNKIDELWQDYAQYRIIGLEKTQCTVSVWPLAANDELALKKGPSLEYQEGLKDSLEAQSGAFQRLKLLMDSWCSFYFWPLQKSTELPSRSAWLAASEVLLGTDKVNDDSSRHMLDITLGDEIKLDELFSESQQQLPDATKLAAAVPWFSVARDADASQNFHHWELIFTEVLGPKFEEQEAEPKGFDLMFGNPPWMKLGWEEQYILSDMDPGLGVTGGGAIEFSKSRKRLFESSDNRNIYKESYRQVQGIISFLGDNTNYKYLVGVKVNLYKCFIHKSWDLLNHSYGICGFIHEEGIFDTTSGESFRSEYYLRLKGRYHFRNELNLFLDVHHAKAFSINIFSGTPCDVEDVGFHYIVNLFSPSTIEQCFINNNVYPAVNLGVKSSSGGWNLVGDSKRKIFVTSRELKVFSKIMEGSEENFILTRLPQVQSQELLSSLKKIADTEDRIGGLDEGIWTALLFDETEAQREGILKKHEMATFIPENWNDFVISGPHFFVGNLCNKTPRSICTDVSHYDEFSLKSDEQLPKTLFSILDYEKFRQGLPEYKGGGVFFQDRSHTDFFRLLIRRRGQSGNERTLIPVIIPPGVSHVNLAISIAFEYYEDLLMFSGLCFSTVFDFLMKVSGRTDFYESTIQAFPYIKTKCTDAISARVLKLSCVTEVFDELWFNHSPENSDGWAMEEESLSSIEGEEFFPSERALGAIKTELGRRQALLEIDVLVSMSFGLTSNELISIYLLQMSALSNYERIDRYDSQGKRLPNTTRKSPGAKELREALIDHDGVTPVTVNWEIDKGNKTVTKTFYPPFNHVDRIEDYKTAYRVFSERLGIDTSKF